MNPEIIHIDYADPAPALDKVARVIRSGGLVAYPTESFYAIGANALDEAAVGRVFRAKGRPEANPVPVIVHDRDALMEVAADVSEEAAQAVERLTPGPVTLVMAAAGGIPQLITGGTGRVGVRIPDDEFMRRLAGLAGVPVTATSANLSGGLGLTDPEEVVRVLGGSLDLILDGGITPGPPPSTVLDVTVWPPAVIRAGRMPREDIWTALGL